MKDVTPLTLAIMEGKHDLVVDMVQRQVDLNEASFVYDQQGCHTWRMETPLVTAARLGHLDIVRVLIEGGAYLDTPDMTDFRSALHWACKKNHTQVALELINAGASVNIRDALYDRPIVEALACRNYVLVDSILNNGLLLDVPLGCDMETSLMKALWLDEIDIAKSFIQAGADVNKMDWEDIMDALEIVLSKPPSIMLPLFHMLLAANCHIKEWHLSKVELLYEHTQSPVYLSIHSLLTATEQPQRLTDICRLQLCHVLKTKAKGTTIQPSIGLLPLPKRLQDYLALVYV